MFLPFRWQILESDMEGRGRGRSRACVCVLSKIVTGSSSRQDTVPTSARALGIGKLRMEKTQITDNPVTNVTIELN